MEFCHVSTIHAIDRSMLTLPLSRRYPQSCSWSKSISLPLRDRVWMSHCRSYHWWARNVSTLSEICPYELSLTCALMTVEMLCINNHALRTDQVVDSTRPRSQMDHTLSIMVSTTPEFGARIWGLCWSSRYATRWDLWSNSLFERNYTLQAISDWQMRYFGKSGRERPFLFLRSMQRTMKRIIEHSP